MENKSKAKFNWRKEVRDIGIMLAVVGVLYATGWHAEVLGGIQRIFLYTGIIQPSTEGKHYGKTDYNFTLIDVGTGTRLSGESLKGKTVLINLWATWCPPCVAEMPDLQALYENVGKEVAFVMISQDDSPEKAKAFIERKGYTFPVYMLTANLPEVFATNSIPTTFVLDSEGNIRSKKVGMARYNTAKFRKFLETLASEGK